MESTRKKKKDGDRDHLDNLQTVVTIDLETSHQQTHLVFSKYISPLKDISCGSFKEYFPHWDYQPSDQLCELLDIPPLNPCCLNLTSLFLLFSSKKSDWNVYPLWVCCCCLKANLLY